jgi:hypothetical protein
MRKALFRFFQLGCASFVTSFVLTVGLHEWVRMPEEAAFAIALVTVLVLNFSVMRWYVYETQTDSLWQQFGLYLCSAFMFRGAEYGAFLLWHTWFGSDYRLAVAGVLFISSGVKFFYYRLLFGWHGRLSIARPV